ncbi:unnamed protein product, partial [Polarella glacialis]
QVAPEPVRKRRPELTKEQAREALDKAIELMEKPENIKRIKDCIADVKKKFKEPGEQEMQLMNTLMIVGQGMLYGLLKEYGFEEDKVIIAVMQIAKHADGDKKMTKKLERVKSSFLDWKADGSANSNCHARQHETSRKPTSDFVASATRRRSRRRVASLAVLVAAAAGGAEAWIALPRGQGPRCQGSRSRTSAAAAGPTAPVISRGEKPAPDTEDAAFRWLGEVLQGRWGDGEVLDAGTGPDSLIWLAKRPVAAITAVTACEGMHETVMEEVACFLDLSRDRLLLGNWQDERLLEGRSFDVVLADYLLGSVDHFSPHFQVGLLQRLQKLVRPGGRLALIGKEPEDLRATDPTSQLVLDAEAVRDAVFVLGRQRPYREMPRQWVSEQLETLGFQLEKSQIFPRRLTVEKVRRNLDWAEEELSQVSHLRLKSDIKRHATGSPK